MKKYVFSLAAVVLAIGGSAFTVASARLTNTWQFTGTAESQILDASKYQMSTTVHEDCGRVSQLPCAIQLPSSVNAGNIDTYFSQNFNEKQDVLAISPAQRPVQ